MTATGMAAVLEVTAVFERAGTTTAPTARAHAVPPIETFVQVFRSAHVVLVVPAPAVLAERAAERPLERVVVLRVVVLRVVMVVSAESSAVG